MNYLTYVLLYHLINIKFSRSHISIIFISLQIDYSTSAKSYRKLIKITEDKKPVNNHTSTGN